LYFFASAGVSKLALKKNAATAQSVMLKMVLMVFLPLSVCALVILPRETEVAPGSEAASRAPAQA
jgi:hypothetical protein